MTGLFPVANQQQTRLAIGGLALQQLFQLTLRRFQLLQLMQGNSELIAVLAVVWLQFNGFGQTQQRVFGLPVIEQPNPQRVLQVRRVGVGFKLIGQQFTRLIGFAAFIQQINLRHHSLEILRVQRQEFFQCCLRLVQLPFMQIQTCELALGLRVVGLCLERTLVLVDDLLQRAEIQTLLIRRQAQQGAGGGKANALLGVIQQRAEQQCALSIGHQPCNTLYRRLTH